MRLADIYVIDASDQTPVKFISKLQLLCYLYVISIYVSICNVSCTNS